MKFYYRNIELEVPENVYYPREDSELLAKIIEKADIKSKAALEIGCGCGFLAVLMVKAGANVTAADIDKKAVETTKANAKQNSVHVNCFVSDLFSNIKGRFDAIVFNPPYLPVEKGENDPAYSGGKTGRETIERFIESSVNYLAPGGMVMLVISSLTGEQETIELFEKQGLHAEAVLREKVPWEELIVIQGKIKAF